MDYTKIWREIEENKDYESIRNEKDIIMLGLGGSYAYGTNNENSDIDIRGFKANTKEEILLGRDFEVKTYSATDTTIYSLKKMFALCSKCNPNTIELLGLKKEQIYKYDEDIWTLIEKNKNLFLSKIAVHTFGSYANSQFRRLSNKEARIVGQTEREEHILNSIKFAEATFRDEAEDFKDSDYFRLSIDKSKKEDMESEIFADIHVSHYPLRDFAALCNNYNSVVRDYDRTLGKRNKNAIERGKLGKHMMHLVRLYYMCFDILEKGLIKTYRDEDHDELMAIRNGYYLKSNDTVTPEFYSFVDSLEARLQKAVANTKLPDNVDKKAIDDLLLKCIEIILERSK